MKNHGWGRKEHEKNSCLSWLCTRSAPSNELGGMCALHGHQWHQCKLWCILHQENRWCAGSESPIANLAVFFVRLYARSLRSDWDRIVKQSNRNQVIEIKNLLSWDGTASKCFEVCFGNSPTSLWVIFCSWIVCWPSNQHQETPPTWFPTQSHWQGDHAIQYIGIVHLSLGRWCSSLIFTHVSAWMRPLHHQDDTVGTCLDDPRMTNSDPNAFQSTSVALLSMLRCGAFASVLIKWPKSSWCIFNTTIVTSNSWRVLSFAVWDDRHTPTSPPTQEKHLEPPVKFQEGLSCENSFRKPQHNECHQECHQCSSAVPCQSTQKHTTKPVFN